MNEEKKLTDEEIAKAILQSIEYSKTITYFDEWGNCKSIFVKDALDLIHRLQGENERLKDMKFTQEHCDLYKENEWLKAELKRELAEHEEFTQKANAEIESLKCDSYRTSWKAKFLQAKKENERLTEEQYKFNSGKYNRALESLSKERRLNAELKKQVDELKAKLYKSKQDMMVFHVSEIKQAVKDTAKEIFTELLKDENVHINVRLDQWGETYNVDCVDFDTIKELAKERYGVEVE